MNRLKTLMLLATLTALLLWAGGALAGRAGFIVALGMASLMNFGAYWFSDGIVMRMYGARELREADAPWLVSAVRELALRGNLPMPKLYLIPEDAPNAFATGRNPDHAAVAVTQGLLGRLDREEVAAAMIAGALIVPANMARGGAIFGAGRSSADEEQGSHPLALAGALRRIEYWSQKAPLRSGSPATAHLCIVKPFSGGGMMRLFSTHPPTEVRIARLRAMAVRGNGVAVSEFMLERRGRR